MDIVTEPIETYLKQFALIDEPVIREMEEYGKSKSFPIVGPVVGRLLMQYAKISGARRIFELGSGFGYSAAWFFLATLANGEIICTESSEENIRLGRNYMSRLGAAGVVKFRHGDALKLIRETEGPFDIIFNDIDKQEYPQAFESALPLLKKGGLFITDNVLLKGKVTSSDPDDTTKAVMEYNRMIYNTPGVMSTIIPIRDGVAVSLKI